MGNRNLAEITFQILNVLWISFINRLITYIPTYSGVKYEEINLTNVVLAFLMVVLSLQTKLGEKTNILASRAFDLVDGSVVVKKKMLKSQILIKTVDTLNTNQVKQIIICKCFRHFTTSTTWFT